jgi:hypothetical protein
VRNLVTLGTPHTGAPLAKAAHAISWALNGLPESRPVAAVMAVSAGISDLTFGYLRDEDWYERLHGAPAGGPPRGGRSSRTTTVTLPPDHVVTYVSAITTIALRRG